jgi:hypothetical protein
MFHEVQFFNIDSQSEFVLPFHIHENNVVR